MLYSNDLAEQLGLTEQELYDLAYVNTRKIFGTKVKGMNEQLLEMMGNEVPDFMREMMMAEEVMYIAMNDVGINGATVIVYSDLLQELADKVNADLYILPSSVHEAILVPDNGEMVADKLRDMVREVNGTEVSEQDYLSDSVYLFSRETGVIDIVEE